MLENNCYRVAFNEHQWAAASVLALDLSVLSSGHRVCLRKNQNKSESPFLKITLSRTFSCNASTDFHSWKQP